MRSLLGLLYHTFPKVRKMTAEKLYTALLTMEEYALVCEKEEMYEGAVEMLSETEWTEQLKNGLGQTKEKMYGFFGMEPPKPASKAA